MDQTAQNVASTRTASGRPVPRGELLVVDDEPDVRRALLRLLEHAGFDVEACADGRSAIERLTTKRFEGVVTDISMPDMNGVALLRHIRSRDADLPVILVTGGPDVQTAIQAIEYGVYRYLVKPIDPAELIGVLEKAVLLYRMAQVRRDVDRVLGGEDRSKLQRHLSSAIDSLWMAFQPIVRPDGTIYGYEALLRSEEPALPHPGAVLHAAEQLDRLGEVGRTVRARATAAFDKAPDDVSLFVNLHARDLADESLTSPDSPLSKIAHRVVLEITERASLNEVRDVRPKIAELRAMGYRIAIDDLGAGYAGLGSFTVLEPEVVKIDMALVRDVDKHPMKKRLIGSIASFCRDMGMLVVGEGVETEEERQALLEVGCGLLQGYLIGRPGRAGFAGAMRT